MEMILLSWLSIGWAQDSASSVVLYADRPRAALTQVVKDTGVNERALDPRRLRELLTETAPYLLGGTSAAGCVGAPATLPEVLKQINVAEELLLVMESERAQDAIEDAHRRWRCLNEPAESAIGARLHMIRGVVRYASGDDGRAQHAFTDAFHYQPDLAWDDDFDAELRPIFDQARQNMETTATFLVTPFDAALTVRVNGQPVLDTGAPISLGTGIHFIQLIDDDGTVNNLWRRVDAGQTLQLVDPRRISNDRIARLSEPEIQSELSLLIGASPLSTRPTFYAPGDGGSWRYAGGDWELMMPTARDRLRANRGWLILGGGASIVAGSGLMMTSAVLAANRRERIETDEDLNTRRYDEIADFWPLLLTGYWGGAALTGLGTASLATGLAFSIEGTF
ncbi:MAG: hypothetical protein AAFV53_28850 [Myxococcota bacterium]